MTAQPCIVLYMQLDFSQTGEVMAKPKLNIRSDSSDWRAAILSNLANTPISMRGYTCPAAESLIQGIKLREETEREAVFAMSGIEALRYVHARMDNALLKRVYWEEDEIPYNSLEHRLLLALFIGEKVRQNKLVQQALLETRGYHIYHDVGVGSPHTSLPEKFYIEVLLQQRRLLERMLEIS